MKETNAKRLVFTRPAFRGFNVPCAFGGMIRLKCLVVDALKYLPRIEGQWLSHHRQGEVSRADRNF